MADERVKDRELAAGHTLREATEARRTEALRSEDHPEWRRLSEGVRRLNRACVESDLDAASLNELASQVEALAGKMESSSEGKRVGLVEEGWHGVSDSLNYLPFSPIMGRLNPASYGLDIVREGEQAIGRVVLDETAEGAVGLSHGGVISGIWDEVLAAANAIQQTGGPTGSLTVRYRRPTPLHEPLRYAAWVEQTEERKVLVKGECTIEGGDGTVLSEAEAVFIRMRVTGIDWHKQRGADDA